MNGLDGYGDWRGAAIPCAIALGGNLGDVPATFAGAIDRLATTPGIAVRSRSSWYRTPPMGPPQPDYWNGCLVIETVLEPAALLGVLQSIEGAFGRQRSQHWGPRTLDLDLILYGDRQIVSPTLTVPHPGFRDRAFVLVPLAEVAGNWIDPVSGQSVACLHQAVDCSQVWPAGVSPPSA